MDSYELRASVTTTVAYRLPGHDRENKTTSSTRAIQDVLRLLPINTVSFYMYDTLCGVVRVNGSDVDVRSSYIIPTVHYYVDAELVPDNESTDFDDVLGEHEVRVRLCDGRIEHRRPELFEIVSFTG